MRFLFLLILMLMTSSTLAATSPKCPGEEGYYFTNDRHSKNPSQGGFVSHDADVTDNIWVGRNAAICGFASVTNAARILGRALVCGDAQVHGSHVRITGYAKVCGTAEVDGSKEDVIIKGYYSANSGLYNKGTYTKEKPVAKVQQKSKHDIVKELVSALNDQSAHYYSFTDGDIRKISYKDHFRVKIDNLNNPCEVLIIKSTKREAEQNRYYANTPYTEETLRINLDKLRVMNIKDSKWKKNYEGMRIFTFGFDRKKTKDLYIFEYEKHHEHGDRWVTRDYKTVSGMWVNSRSKSELQRISEKFRAAVNICSKP
ncbi:hypothetical protein [Celerinatantimonas sp. YJH-8]|uniref:hypothetical protein n=1 Tax=Celerinatantimonas sp. YJH-8 TaxID=3228714 RepID=UPI0038C342D2